ncbi:TadE/TadG family type IV pilus assembly protein [Vibrio astriarenae]
MQHSLSKQSGHAAILFAMMIPAFFGLFTLGSDGARMMQSKARLGDAMEAASLAVTAHASTDNSANGINQTIANNYIEYYAADLKEVNSVSVTRRDCDTATECVPGEDMKFFQYDVTASVAFDSWFPGNEAIVGFGENFSVGAAGRARKYQSHAIDVVLAADFSGSMRERWDNNNSNREVKYIELMEIVGLVATELENFNDIVEVGQNTIGFAPYDHLARIRVGYDSPSGSFVFDDYCNNYDKRLRVPRETAGASHDSKEESGTLDSSGLVLGRVNNVVFNSNQRVDYSSTINRIRTVTPFGHSTQKDAKIDGDIEGFLLPDSYSYINNLHLDMNSYDSGSPSFCNPDNTYRAKFYSIGLTSDFESFIAETSRFRPDAKSGRGFTASFQGFLEGSRILKSGVNERKLLILLSDGEDNSCCGFTSIDKENSNSEYVEGTSFKTIANKLIRGTETDGLGMCEEIRDHLKVIPSKSDTEAHVEMAVIGFDYDPDDHPALAECVGSDNVYRAQNKEEILAQILSLIAEEIGRLK